MNEAIKITGKGLLGIFGCFLAGKLCMAFGWMVTACFLTVIIGIVSPFFIMNDRSGIASLMTGIFGIIFAGILPALLTDYKGFGFSAKNISIRDIKDHSFSTKFSFTDAYVEAYLDGHKSVYGKRFKVGDIYAAPLVEKGWDKTKEIKAWALSELYEDTLWTQNCNAALQKIENEDARIAIIRAAGKFKLKTSDDAILLYWTNNVEGEWKWELLSGILTPMIISLIWIVVSFASYNYNGPIVSKNKSEHNQMPL